MEQTTPEGAVVPEPAVPEAPVALPAPVLQPAVVVELDRAVADVSRAKDAWLRADVRSRMALLDRCLQTTLAISEDWVEHGLPLRELPPRSKVVGLEWLMGPDFILRYLRELRSTLRDIARLGYPRLPGPERVRADGTLTVGVFPRRFTDRLLLPGYSAEVWMRPGITPHNLHGHLASAYSIGSDLKPEVCLVLGAGNLPSVAPNDALYHLFIHKRVVVLKISPVFDDDVPFLERAFAPLLQAGVLRVVHGGAAEGTYLAHHPRVDVVQLTGSDRTYDALVFGEGDRGRQNKAAGDPVLQKPVFAECGVVTPVLVVPGDWKHEELELQAENILSSFVANAGQTCVTPRLIVTDRAWPLRAAFLDALRNVLERAPTRYPFHPGAPERIARFVAAHPDAEQLGKVSGRRVPWLFISHLDSEDADELAYVSDPFCGVLSETSIGGCESPAEFLTAATHFANDRVWGTLNAMVVVNPRSLMNAQTNAAFDRALAQLRYGNIVVNAGPGLPYLLTTPPWGAYPGNARAAIGSGVGVVHNALMLEDTLKTVSRGPFRPFPKPPWFITHGRPRELFEAMTEWDATHHLSALARTVWRGVSG